MLGLKASISSVIHASASRQGSTSGQQGTALTPCAITEVITFEDSDRDRRDQQFLVADGSGRAWLAHRYVYVRRHPLSLGRTTQRRSVTAFPSAEPPPPT